MDNFWSFLLAAWGIFLVVMYATDRLEANKVTGIALGLVLLMAAFAT